MTPLHLEKDDFDGDDGPPRRRGKGKLDSLPGGAFKASRMSQTEVALRLANGLCDSPLVDGPIVLMLAGYELTRQNAPKYPVVSMLEKWGYARDTPDESKFKWEGLYMKKDHPRYIIVVYNRLHASLQTNLTTGQHLTVFVSAGPLIETRSSDENRQFSSVVGRALTYPHAEPDDLLAVCVPRSPRFRKIVADARNADGVKRARLLFLLVDRGGGFSGLEPESVVSPGA